jgi:hypothetical protein
LVLLVVGVLLYLVSTALFGLLVGKRTGYPSFMGRLGETKAAFKTGEFP